MLVFCLCTTKKFFISSCKKHLARCKFFLLPSLNMKFLHIGKLEENSAQGFVAWLRETEPLKHQVQWGKADIMYSTFFCSFHQVVTHHFWMTQLLAENWDNCRNFHISLPALGNVNKLLLACHASPCESAKFGKIWMCFKAFKSQENHLKALRDTQCLPANTHGRPASINSFSWLTCSANIPYFLVSLAAAARTRDGWVGKCCCPAASLKICVVNGETKIPASS